MRYNIVDIFHQTCIVKQAKTWYGWRTIAILWPEEWLKMDYTQQINALEDKAQFK